MATSFLPGFEPKPPSVRAGYSFDGRNPSAQNAVDAYRRRYTWNIAHQTRQSINALVRHSIAEGVSPQDTADLISKTIGMNSRQATAAMRYRSRLEKSGLTSKRISAEMNRYTRQKIQERAWTIARTETMGALNAGALESYRQARLTGFLSEEAVKTWIVTPDEKLCAICSGNAGEDIPLDAAFESGDVMPPAHPRCRCTVAVNELLPGEEPRRKGLRPESVFNDKNWDPTQFDSDNALANDLRRRAGVSTDLVESFKWDDAYCTLVQAAGRYHYKQGVGDSNFIGLSRDTTTKVNNSRSKTLGTNKHANYEGTQTILHELGHANSPVIKAKAYRGRNIPLEEGIVELRGLEFADRLYGTNWKQTGWNWAYKQQVAGIERILKENRLTTEQFYQMDAEARLSSAREAGMKVVEKAAGKIHPELGRNIRSWIEQDATNTPYLEAFGMDVIMDPSLYGRTTQPFSARGFRNWLQNQGIESSKLREFVDSLGED